MRRFLIELLLLCVLSVGIMGFGVLLADAQPQPADGSVPAADAGEIPPPPASDVSRETPEAAAGGSASAAGDSGGDGEADDGEKQGEIGTAVQLFRAVRSGEWSIAVGLAIVLLVAGLRSVVLGSWIPWFKTRLGGYVLAFVTGAGVIIGPGLAAGAAFNWALVGAALSAGWAAIGMHTTWKDAKAARAPSG